MIFYIKDLRTKEVIAKANSAEEAIEKLKALGEGIVEII